MKETLILITDHFPYGTGEPFLEEELPFLSEAFDEVILLARNKAKTARPLPSNTFAVPLRKRLSLGSSFLFLFSSFGLSEMKGKPLFLRMEAMKHIWRSSQIIDELEALLKERLGRERITLYSYWLYYGALALARVKDKYPGLTAVSRAHGYDLYEERRKNKPLPFRPLIARQLDGIFFISRHGKEYFESRYPEGKEKYHLSYLGVGSTKRLEKKEPGFFHVVSCSGLTPNKRLDTIARALAGLKGIPVRWTHFGGPLRGEEMEKVKAALQESSQIQWNFPGWVPREKIRSFYAEEKIHCFVNASMTEGLPVSIMEAMQAGIPVIAPAVGGIGEIVDSESGFLLPEACSSEEIGQALLKLMKDPEKRDEMGRKAYEKASCLFSAEINYKAFSKTLRQRAKRILYLYWGKLSKSSGPCGHVLGLIKGWIKQGYKVDLLSFSSEWSPEISGLYHESLPRKGTPWERIVSFRRRAFQLIRKNPYDCLYLRMSQQLFFGSRTGLPALYEANGIIEVEAPLIKEKYPLYARLERAFCLPRLIRDMRRALGVIVITSRMKDYFIRKYKIEEKRLLVTGNGAEPSSKPASFQQGEKDLSLVFVGNLRKWQGIGRVIDEMIKRDRRDFSLTVIGGGELFESLREKARKNPHLSITLTGPLPREEMLVYLGECDMGLLPITGQRVNRVRGVYPLKLNEYWLAGLPILASDIPDMDIVERIGGGFNFRADDYDDFFSRLDRFAALSPEQRQKMGEKGQDYVLNHKTWEMISRDVVCFMKGDL